MAVTVDEVLDALVDNADFEEVGSLAKARAFATAVKRFMILTPSTQADQGSTAAFSPEHIQNLMLRAQAFIAANAGSGNSRTLVPSEDFR